MTVLRLFAFQPSTPGMAPSADGSGQGADTQMGGATVSTELPATGTLDLVPDSWSDILDTLPINGSVKAVAGLLVVSSVTGNKVHFSVASDDKILITPRFQETLSKALSAHYGLDVRAVVSAVDQHDQQTPAELAHQEVEAAQSDAQAAIESDPVIQKLKKQFDATVVPESVRPVDTRSH